MKQVLRRSEKGIPRIIPEAVENYFVIIFLWPLKPNLRYINKFWTHVITSFLVCCFCEFSSNFFSTFLPRRLKTGSLLTRLVAFYCSPDIPFFVWVISSFIISIILSASCDCLVSRILLFFVTPFSEGTSFLIKNLLFIIAEMRGSRKPRNQNFSSSP